MIYVNVFRCLQYGRSSWCSCQSVEDSGDAFASAPGSRGRQVYLVTGCASGIGLACAKALFAAGGTVVMACRAGSKAEQAKEVGMGSPSPLFQEHISRVPSQRGSQVRVVLTCSHPYFSRRSKMKGILPRSGSLLHLASDSLPMRAAQKPSRAPGDPYRQHVKSSVNVPKRFSPYYAEFF